MLDRGDWGNIDKGLGNGGNTAQGLVPECDRTTLCSSRSRRKLQVGNGFLLEFEQLSRILNYLLTHHVAKRRISRKELQKETGLSDRHIESLISMGTAMGLIKPRLQVLTSAGYIIAKHDLFFEKKGTLEWCHYMGAGSYQNLIWFEAFNRLLQEKTLLSQEGWYSWFRDALSGSYSKGTIGRGVVQEVRFVIDAYMNQNLSNLGVLERLPDGRLYSQRYANFAKAVFAAMIYEFFDKNKARLYQVPEIVGRPGSPAMVFKLDETSFRQQIDDIHECGWVRYETTHGLDQIRLKPGFSACDFLAAYYEEKEPCQPELGGTV